MSQASLNGQLKYQLNEGASASSVVLALAKSVTVTERSEQVLSVVGPVTDQAVSFGSVGSAKLAWIENLSATESVTFKLNGSSTALPLSPGGLHFVLNPLGGITGMTFSYAGTGTASLKVLVME